MGYSNKNSYSIWRITLLAGIVGGFGGLLVDADHILSAATEGATPWSFLHQPIVVIVLIGCVIASLGGLVLSLVLRSKR